MRPSLVINGIDFNERLDKERENLHWYIDVRRFAEYYQGVEIMQERNGSILDFIKRRGYDDFVLKYPRTTREAFNT